MAWRRPRVLSTSAAARAAVSSRIRSRADDKESRRWLDGYDKAVELAAACPSTRVLVICDREGDIWDLLARSTEHEAGLLVRARRCGGPRRRKERKGVRLEVRAARVDLAPPDKKPQATPPLSMMAMRVTEPAPPPGRDSLDWMLLTTEGDVTADDALKTVSFYERRWWIEEYFKALKVGTRIKDRRLNQADDLKKCLAFDAITACRVMTIERLARSRAPTPASSIVHRDEITVLAIHNRPTAHAAWTSRSRTDHRSLRRRGRTPGRLHPQKASTFAGNREALA